MTGSCRVSLSDAMFSTAVITASALMWVSYGHHGLVMTLLAVIGLCIFGDVIEVLRYRGSLSQRIKDIKVAPVEPDMPQEWYFVTIVLQAAALLAQLIGGLTILCGLLLTFIYGGASTFLHLRYYSGSCKENCATLLPTLSILGLVVCTVLSAPGNGIGYRSVGIHDKWGAAAILGVFGIFGACSAQAFCWYMGVRVIDAKEHLPIADPNK
mmetsp:Transcript_26118/g.39685  ORF Transcript_26118/g.39685 Transcript_26118/m.39685 type:complete len:211 (+) Transcript_26118:91-723(+)|eukprot:CAMPEP_0206463484 /NCGR_PEP_ID=MMETSP0324_2-20121206/26637_1 /ASSEMBLY_ACC=CAM_ASM_000836 /TAXON_ID=2866 /ORGANISM="Crypthecodinium cohnii, Strain Seligo" /LENGTH=210 /DNA_ID=CAMNT_0053935911 /DNA_START=102 /DNA_END=734 /DNA_ORIENTATION=+